ncbi:MAG TPA: hypothetical protein VME44_25840 [Streptosporangiaceae bacterium]|nr:hypothetical protein [Streptosporangiaceae bacterium]
MPARPATAITARPQRAIEASTVPYGTVPERIEAPAAVHYHLHLHALPAAQPIAIEEER